MTTRKHILLIPLVIFLVCLLFSVSCGDDDAATFTETPGGVIYKAGDISVIELHGNYREMGRQYGYLLKNELHEFYSLAIEEYFVKEKGIPLELLKEGCEGDFMLYPERFKNIIYGMAETSEMDLYKLIILDQIIVLGSIFCSYDACSGVAAWGDYTDNNTLVFGRNFDYFEDYKRFAGFMTVVVYNPDDGSVPTATFGYTGQIQTINGINKEGIFLEMNAGTLSGGTTPYPGRIPPFIQFLSFLLDSSTMTQLDTAFNTGQTIIALIVNVADRDRACSYEWTISDLKRREGEDEGFLVATNHFINPEWAISPPPDDHSSVVRRNNLLLLGEKNRGQFNEQKMMEILDIKMEDGGITKSDTIFQIVTVPRKLKLWIKIPGHQEWTPVDLNNSFFSALYNPSNLC